MNVGQLSTKGAITASPGTPLVEVARLMLEENVGAMVITKSPLDRPVVVGIVTDRDITRKLEDYERKRRGDVKSRSEPAHGWITELDAEHGSARIETEDGRLIYFHRNSVIGGRFQDLTTGTEVRFAEETGDLGPAGQHGSGHFVGRCVT
jgi:CBS domain-containing protein